LVHVRRRSLVVERLALHDVAPVAGRVADGDEQGLALGAGACESLLPPRLPVDRVLGVLEGVRAGLVCAPVRPRGIITAVSYDTIRAQTDVASNGESQSRPGKGIVTVRTRGLTQRDEVVIEFERSIMVALWRTPRSRRSAFSSGSRARAISTTSRRRSPTPR